MRASVPRLIAALLSLSLALACSRVPPGGEVALQGANPTATDGAVAGLDPLSGGESLGEGSDGTTATGGFGGTGTDGTGGTTTAGTSGGATAAGGTGGSSGAATSGTGGGATAGGSGGGGDVGSGPSGQSATGVGPGVDGRTIKVVFHAMLSDCPNQETNPKPEQYERMRMVIGEWVKFYNRYVLAEHNWKLQHFLVDDGGYFCPERQRAAALKIAKEIKPLAALGDSASTQGPIVADVVTRAGIMHIGANWQFQAEERARHPYAWNAGPTVERSLTFMVEWMQRRIKGTKVPDRSNPTEPMVDRVYGILGLDETVGHKLAKITQDSMKAAGMSVAGTYLISADGGVAAQQAPAVISKMREDGVNTVLWAVEFGGGKSFYIPLTNAMESQNYLPDIMIGTAGTAFWDGLNARRVWANAKGTSANGIIANRNAVEADGSEEAQFAEVNENGNAFRKAWEKMGHNDSPLAGWGGSFGAWTQLAMLVTGVIHGGKVLNPHTVAQGIESAGTADSPNRCTVARFMGRDYKHVPSRSWDSAHDGGMEGYATVYWVNRQSTFGTNGYYESFDNYIFYRSAKDMPAKPSHDTGVKGPAVKKQKRIGLHPWTSCSKLSSFPR